MDPKQTKFKSKLYLDYVRKQPCLVCGKSGSDPHHVRHARLNDYYCLPLCRYHHGELHSSGHSTFFDKYSINPDWAVISLLVKYCDK